MMMGILSLHAMRARRIRLHAFFRIFRLLVVSCSNLLPELLLLEKNSGRGRGQRVALRKTASLRRDTGLQIWGILLVCLLVLV